eukprot:gene18049-biopygen3904
MELQNSRWNFGIPGQIAGGIAAFQPRGPAPRGRVWVPRSRVWAPRSRVWAPRSRVWAPRSRVWVPRSRVWAPRSRVWVPRSRVWVPRPPPADGPPVAAAQPQGAPFGTQGIGRGGGDSPWPVPPDPIAGSSPPLPQQPRGLFGDAGMDGMSGRDIRAVAAAAERRCVGYPLGPQNIFRERGFRTTSSVPLPPHATAAARQSAGPRGRREHICGWWPPLRTGSSRGPAQRGHRVHHRFSHQTGLKKVKSRGHRGSLWAAPPYCRGGRGFRVFGISGIPRGGSRYANPRLAPRVRPHAARGPGARMGRMGAEVGPAFRRLSRVAQVNGMGIVANSSRRARATPAPRASVFCPPWLHGSLWKTKADADGTRTGHGHHDRIQWNRRGPGAGSAVSPSPWAARLAAEGAVACAPPADVYAAMLWARRAPPVGKQDYSLSSAVSLDTTLRAPGAVRIAARTREKRAQ